MLIHLIKLHHHSGTDSHTTILTLTRSVGTTALSPAICTTMSSCSSTVGKLDVTHEFLLLLYFTAVVPCHDCVFIQIFNLTLQKKRALRFKTILELKTREYDVRIILKWAPISPESFPSHWYYGILWYQNA